MLDVINDARLEIENSGIACFARCRGYRSRSSLMPRTIVSSAQISLSAPMDNGQIGLNSATLFVNGDIDLPPTWSSLIISDGDVYCESKATRNSIVIARGNVGGNFLNSLVLAGKNYVTTKGVILRNDVPVTFRLGGKLDIKIAEGVELKRFSIEEQVAKPFGFIRFFETLELGIDTTLNKAKQVQVSILDPKLLFGQAGFRKDDLIETVNGKPVDSPETFRRLVRSAIIDTRAEFVLNRNGEKKKIAVEFPLDCLKDSKIPR
jgi:hypothetical protein